jgi:Flp pilus assembly protein TadD
MRSNLTYTIPLPADEADTAEMQCVELAREAHAADALFQLALYEMRRGSLDYAEPVLRRALADEPNDAALWNNLGVLLARTGRLDEAADAFACAVDLNPYDDATANLEQILHGGSGPWRLTVTRQPPAMPLTAAA